MSTLGAFSKLLGTTKDVGEKLFDSGKESLLVAIPATSLVAAYLTSKLLSPHAVKENINDIVINANEKTNLAETVRDLARLKANKNLKSTAKIHDQFI